ncbi:hypothetical protein MCHI_000083 [Candidatus Magnetoovum chiemensis]|nr:hypothetical protein MCHI_000083 [Candidatus Magnetoovum chiemensis]
MPVLKKIKIKDLRQMSSTLEEFRSQMPDGITDVDVNPITGSLKIKYEPSAINILGYLHKIMDDGSLNFIIDKIEAL